MKATEGYVLRPVAVVESELLDRADAPKQGDEGAPDAWIVFDTGMVAAMRDLETGADALVLTWLDRADRAVLTTRPRDDPQNPLVGVFSTRSPDRPNPIGVHRVRILGVEGLRVHVAGLEALDGTPVVDVKPVLDRHLER